jgi:AraC-like DNA-binding protein/uncharacterized glyoxalase superfamily protein PhnB
MAFVPPARHLLRAKDLADARYFEPLGVDDLARAAGLSRAHFSREFRRAFGESPHAYLLTRRLERAAALLRTTDKSVAEICLAIGLQGLGSFTTSFKRTYGMTPTAYRAAFPPAASQAVVPACIVRTYGRPQHRTFREAARGPRPSIGAKLIPTKESSMKIANAQLWVHDQDEALAFYTEKLGMEVRNDVTLAEMGDFRWLTVSPPGQEEVAITLMAIPGPPVMDAETTEQLRTVMAKGFAGTVFLTTDDCQASYEELKARGVEFSEQPEERPYGIDSGFRDPSGNSIRLTEVKLPATA